jgi:imidazole glycerol-phosphate synthase subunit HisF
LYRPRVIPVLLLNETGDSIKSIKFNKRIYLGDPVNTVSLFNSFQVDELILLNIDSRKKNFKIDYHLLANIAEEAEMPFAIGGGIHSLGQIRRILSLGAEKVVLSQSAIQTPDFLKEAVECFGSSSITVCLDVKKNLFGRYAVYVHQKKLSLSLDQCLDIIEESQAGELVLQNISLDGAMTGYDGHLLQYVSNYMSMPVVALGGAGSHLDMKLLNNQSNVSAFAAGSLFVFQGRDRGVLINYPSAEELMELCIIEKYS